MKMDIIYQLKSELYIQALSPGCFTRFENSENRSSPGCFTSTKNRITQWCLDVDEREKKITMFE